ncbi:MAG: hypothetical protein ACTSX6_06435 [Candidatus Heimdallarchaeaceae archaeon]
MAKKRKTKRKSQPVSELPEMVKDLFSDIEKKVEDFSPTMERIENEIKRVKDGLKQIDNYTKEVRELTTSYQSAFERVQKKMDEITKKIDNYRKETDKLKEKANRKIEDYESYLKTVSENVILPSQELLKNIDNTKKELDSIESEITETSGKVKSYAELTEPNLLTNILTKYGRRTEPEDEAKNVIRLLDEDPKVLKDAITLGRKMGKTNYELMPIIAVYQLKFYEDGEPNVERCRKLGVDPQSIDRYISHIAMSTKDEYIRDLITTARFTKYKE